MAAQFDAEAIAERVKAMEGPQHVYFVGTHEINRVKIGLAKNPKKRLAALQNGSPCRLHLWGIFPFAGEDAEKFLHKTFRDTHSHGEWFTVTDEIRDLSRFLVDYNAQIAGDECVKLLIRREGTKCAVTDRWDTEVFVSGMGLEEAEEFRSKYNGCNIALIRTHARLLY